MSFSGLRRKLSRYPFPCVHLVKPLTWERFNWECETRSRVSSTRSRGQGWTVAEPRISRVEL